MTKQKLTTNYCIDRQCGFEETSHKVRDGWHCPKCCGPMSTRPQGQKVFKQTLFPFEGHQNARYVKRNAPPNIMIRIMAAMKEEAFYQVVHYNRKEGATSSIIEIAKQFSDVMVTCDSRCKHVFNEVGGQWIALTRESLEGRSGGIILVDAPAKQIEIDRILSMARDRGMKVVVIKGITLAFDLNGDDHNSDSTEKTM